ncbi:agamous-like MADS-box protein AGL62 [Ricinus communis]|uniref:agamous-like MADS-box protein AGL62 n=1 Tax=Ricinus communis TaxID=3988 RepID=UPI00201AC934|nr:agamous-like MADS-box protein AGL62 [Ricinus communis]
MLFQDNFSCSSILAMSKLTGKGRQRIEMVKISKESNRLVTFSKRRYGVFKKASELSTLCGAEISIIVFSPGKRAFSFGNPSVETVVDRFLSNKPPRISGSLQLIEAHRSSRLRELNMLLTKTLNELEMEKKRGEELDRIRKASQAQHWWESPIEELDLTQLKQLKASLEMLRQNVGKQAEQLLFQATNSHQFYAPTTSNRVLPFDPKNGGFNTTLMPYQYPNLGCGGFY